MKTAAKVANVGLVMVVCIASICDSLYASCSHFRPRDVLIGIFLLSFNKLCVHAHVYKTTFERNYTLE